MSTAVRNKRGGQRHKSIEELVAFAIGHPIRVEILVTLADGEFAASEIAEFIEMPLNAVANHLRELVDGGLVEVARKEQRRGGVKHYYRSVEIPNYSTEEIEAMPVHQRQMTAGFVIQSFLAEVMSALWKGMLSGDPDVWLYWKSVSLDEEGRREIDEEFKESRARIERIEEAAKGRTARAGRAPFIAALYGFERGRKSPRPL